MYPCPTAHASSVSKEKHVPVLPARISYHSFFTAIAAKYQQVWYGCTHVLEFPNQGFPHHSRVSLHKTFTAASCRGRVDNHESYSMQGSGPCQISLGSTTVAVGTVGMHVTDRPTTTATKPIACQRDPRPITIYHHPVLLAAKHSMEELHSSTEKRDRKFDEPDYPSRRTPVTRQQSISKEKRRKIKTRVGRSAVFHRAGLFMHAADESRDALRNAGCCVTTLKREPAHLAAKRGKR
jgi:hypothetical protein